MDFKEYQEKANATAIYPRTIWNSGIYYTALGLTSEAGEVASIIKKVLRDNNMIFDERSKVLIKGELGDILWYVATLAKEFDLDMDDIANANVQKLLDRKTRNVIKGSGDNR